MKKLWAAAEVGLGLFLITPIDEVAVAAATAGASLPSSPIQGPASAVIGLALVSDGMRRILR